ncbi:MAG: protein-glutamate O-methyltransferase [Nitrospirales bacterium]|nr:protein-glutamate O-methyltransferase [Nitrospirales bacterium]
MSEQDFDKLSQFIHMHCGIKITPAKKVMIEARLSKRMKLLGIIGFRSYCDYLFSNKGLAEELRHMIDVITTNKTDFFREPAHFNYLITKAIPELICLHKAGIERKLRIWSAGCSTGEEPYTLAMILHDLTERRQGFNYEILATDISSRVLEAAQIAVYEEEKIIPVTEEMKKKYLLRGRNEHSGKVRIVPELRAMVTFRRLNFMEADFELKAPMDIIFCRNVIIYFDRDTQEKLMRKFYNHLMPGGYLFLGHSETLNGMSIPLASVAPTVYRKTP